MQDYINTRYITLLGSGLPFPMNHLCDLTIKLDGGGAINRLATDECVVLTEFRSR